MAAPPDSLLDDLTAEERRQLFDALDAAGDDEDGGADSLLDDLTDEQRRFLDLWLDDPYAGDDAEDLNQDELDEVDRLVEQIGAGAHPLDFFYDVSDPILEPVPRFGIQG